MSGDIIHHGHINILKIANAYGYVVLGILTNKAISEYKDSPVTTFNQRKLVFKSIKYVNKIIPQTTHDYTYNLKKLKPKYVIHGNDWKKGSQKLVREKSNKYFENYGMENLLSPNIQRKFLQLY